MLERVAPRAAHLVSALDLRPHPEGGYFREVYRSASRVQPFDGRQERSALTTIYFLLAAGDRSAWHRVDSDEVWHYYEGDVLELFMADSHFTAVTSRRLGPVGEHQQPVHVVPAGVWQAARSTGAYTLVGCTVGPGFDFADFEMLRDLPGEAETARRRRPDLISLI
jgi:predicted cupin superfamily sugar epimerase